MGISMNNRYPTYQQITNEKNRTVGLELENKSKIPDRAMKFSNLPLLDSRDFMKKRTIREEHWKSIEDK